MAPPRSSRPITADEPDSGPRTLPWLHGGEVLVADDDPSIRKVLARAFERFGMTVTSCEDGDDALAQVVHDPARWHLVALDLTMPRMGGDDALARMRSVRADLPALILSGFLEADMQDRVAGLGRVAVLQKPFTLRALADALWEVLGPED
ncbi:MAG: response regulator [Gemmatimonadaceae bacterium]|nr:response regulator [Gemmatimonadaceae bacterium]